MLRRRSATQLQERGNLQEDSETEQYHNEKRAIPHIYYKTVFISSLFFVIVLFFLSASKHVLEISTMFATTSHVDTSEYELRDSLDWVIEPSKYTNREAKTIHYHWNITTGFVRPDGVLKKIYLINSLFPGPTVQARSGDTLVIVVENQLEGVESVSIHWHGLHMNGFNDMDGAVGFTQAPILPNSSFTYKFRISDAQHGTFWYHAHDGVQRADGLFGALIIHRPADIKNRLTEKDMYGYDEERILMIGDWYHSPANDVLATYMDPGSFGNEPVPDSLLVNGMGAYNCSNAVKARPVSCLEVEPDKLPTLSFHSFKMYRLRILNVGVLAGVTLTLEGANLTLIQLDGGNRVIPTPALSIGVVHPGQRTDVIAHFGRTYPEMEFKIKLDDDVFTYTNPALTEEQRFPILIKSSEEYGETNHNNDIMPDINIDNADAPLLAELLPQISDVTLVIYTTTQKLSHLDNIPHGFMNQTTWKPQQSPPGYLLGLPRSQWDSNQFIPIIPATAPSGPLSDNQRAWVNLILNNLDDSSHPFHLHGYTVYVLQTYTSGYGWGSYNPYEILEPPGGTINLKNPIRRDTVWVPKRGYSILGFWADNEGIWMLHCHNLWHQASGMVMGLQVGDFKPIHDPN